MSDLIFLDDERVGKEAYPQYRGTMYTCRTVAQAIGILKRIPIDIVSLDHDLGGGEDTIVLIKWMEEQDHWPHGFFIHTMNPVGRQRLTSAIEANGYRASVHVEIASNGRMFWSRPIGYTKPVRAWWNQEKDDLP